MYVTQRDKTSCAPLALMHCLRWLGFRAEMCRLYRLKELVEWVPRKGTDKRKFFKVLSQFGFKRMRRVSVDRIDKSLAAGNILLVTSDYPKVKSGPAAHSYVITNGTARYYYCVNLIGTYNRLGKKEVAKKHLINAKVFVVSPVRMGSFELVPEYHVTTK